MCYWLVSDIEVGEK